MPNAIKSDITEVLGLSYENQQVPRFGNCPSSNSRIGAAEISRGNVMATGAKRSGATLCFR
jgi:hypothetical protein